MKNGDISNQVVEYLVYMDGKNVLYYDVPGWYHKLNRRLARWLKKPVRMLHSIEIDRTGMRMVRNLLQNDLLRFKVMSFTEEEEYILRECIFKTLGMQYIVEAVPTQDHFKWLCEAATLLISNKFPGVNAAGKREMYHNAMQVQLIVAHEIGFTRK